MKHIFILSHPNATIFAYADNVASLSFYSDQVQSLHKLRKYLTNNKIYNLTKKKLKKEEGHRKFKFVISRNANRNLC